MKALGRYLAACGPLLVLGLACSAVYAQQLVVAAAPLQEVVVSAQRLELIGNATTASEGVVAGDELALTPAYRPGQLLETVPGLDVTLHSGEGKANQYLMRGYNLDHGTDLATFVDGMPVNEPSHAHGQEYTDLNFLIPELAAGVTYTKGTEYADEGDFASVGSVHVSYLDTIAGQVSLSAGAFDYQRAFTAGSAAFGAGNLLGALELTHYDGPWSTPGDQPKINAVVRYSGGTAQDGYSLTASLYHGLWNNQTDVPERAIAQSLIGRFGQLDPSDRGRAQRANLTGEEHRMFGAGVLTVSAYAFSNQLTLINDFTHFLVDPVNGDQEQQHEDRTALGGTVSYLRPATLLGRDSELLLGFQGRYDFLEVARIPTRNAQPIPAADHPLGFSEDDRILLASDALYAQVSTHWTGWFRTVIGLREDYLYGSDAGSNPGSASRGLLQPKASLIFRLAAGSELYFSAGRGFHSDDLRGVNQARITHTPGAPLLASQTGEEIGLRQELFAHRLAATVALFNLDAQSEITYNPDQGMDSAGPGSHRIGYELNFTYQALRWLEFYGSFSQDRARYTTAFDDGTGHVGFYLPNAPFATGSLNIYLKNLGRWSGGLEYRYLGAFPLSSDDRVQGSGYGEWNGDLHYCLPGGWGVAAGLFNILNSHANAMEYWYVDRLPGEPATGEADIHVHPLEPRALRLTVSKNF